MWAILKLAFGAATGGIGPAATAVGGWLLKHWKLALAVLLALSIGIAFKVVLHQRDYARAQVAADAATIKTLTGQKQALQANVNDLTAKITVQSASIDGLRTAAQTAQDAARKAMQAAATQSRKDAGKIAALKQRGADKSNRGSCDAEIIRIRAGL